jgi:hypothetical protein
MEFVKYSNFARIVGRSDEEGQASAIDPLQRVTVPALLLAFSKKLL